MPRLIPRAGNEPSEEMVSRYGEQMAKLLTIRGIENPGEAEIFLHPSPEQFHDPMLLHGMAETLSLIREAREKRFKVVVYGDYDADGICSCAILTIALHQMGIMVSTYTPLRAEGYGLNNAALEKIRDRCDLLITVDLGITNHSEVRYAHKLGMKVIVTDHHTPNEYESPADAVVHPMLGNYPFPKLCGTGVAFKIAQALLGMEKSSELLDIAAIGTVADLVPLRGENRVIVKLGLSLVNSRRRVGIKALTTVMGLEGPLGSESIAYQLAPRLNASGRMGDAGEGVKLMLTESTEEALEIAEKLNEWNTLRKKEEEEVLSACERMISEYDLIGSWGIILRGENWHSGVLGLAAGRITQKYSCPSCILSQSGENQLSGSLRSVPGINIHKCLTACDDLLIHWGGHEAAAGVTLSESKYDEFCIRLQEEIMKSEPSCFLPRQDYDLTVGIKELNEKLLSQMDRLAPFGFGNPSPLLATFGAKLEQRRAVGVEGRHLKLTLRQNTVLIDGIAFNKGHLTTRLPEMVDTVYSLGHNTYRGVTNLQINVCEIQPERNARLRSVRDRSQEAAAVSLLRFMESLTDLPDAGAVPAAAQPLQDAASLPEILSSLERGHLLVAHTPQTAAFYLAGFPQLMMDDSENPQYFPSLLVCPERIPASGDWRHIWLLDGAVSPREAVLWRNHFPGAKIHCLPVSELLKRLIRLVNSDRNDWAAVYRAVKDREAVSLLQFSTICGLSLSKTLAVMMILRQSGLIRFQERPFSKELIPCTRKVKIEEQSEIWKMLKALI